jgi:hypothetical protein
VGKTPHPAKTPEAVRFAAGDHACDDYAVTLSRSIAGA